jgi:hypothetical protein
LNDEDDDNDGIPDNTENPCKNIYTFNVNTEGWVTLNQINGVFSNSTNPISHSKSAVTGNVGCRISNTGSANAQIAGASPTRSNYLVDADPNFGDMFIRSPNYGGRDITSFIGGTFNFDHYNFRVGFIGNPSVGSSSGWSTTETIIYLIGGGDTITATTPIDTDAFENGEWNTQSVPMELSRWGGDQAKFKNVLYNLETISIRVEFIISGNTGNCRDVEYYAIDKLYFDRILFVATILIMMVYQITLI